jgi:hypothetical protein
MTSANRRKGPARLLLDPDFNEEIERLAHKMGMSSRPPFVIYGPTEVIRADLDGRPLPTAGTTSAQR